MDYFELAAMDELVNCSQTDATFCFERQLLFFMYAFVYIEIISKTA